MEPLKEPTDDLVHHPDCVLTTPFAQLSFVRAYCSCDEHGGPVSERDYRRLCRERKEG